MFSSIVALSLALLAPSAYGAILDVNVGPNGQFVYEPPFVHAAPGDIVRFHLLVSLVLSLSRFFTDSI